MPIAQKPGANTKAPQPVDEKQIEQFISSAGKAQIEQPVAHGKKKPAGARFNPEDYPRIDAAAARRGLSRAGWIRMVVMKELEAEERDLKASAI